MLQLELLPCNRLYNTSYIAATMVVLLQYLDLLRACNYGCGMEQTRWWKYVVSVAGDIQNKDIADEVGIDKSNVTRWSKGSRPAVEFALKFARAYNQSVVVALTEAGYITDEESNVREVRVGVKDLSDLELARELHVRMEEREQAEAQRDMELHPERYALAASKANYDAEAEAGQEFP